MKLLVRGANWRYVELSWDAWIHIQIEHFEFANSLEMSGDCRVRWGFRPGHNGVPPGCKPEPEALEMNVRMGGHEFDSVTYDAERDVLYLRRGEPRPAWETLASPEGHAIRLDETGDIIGITVVGAKWWVDRDGRITVTIPEVTVPQSKRAPERLETSAEELAPALAA